MQNHYIFCGKFSEKYFDIVVLLYFQFDQS